MSAATFMVVVMVMLVMMLMLIMVMSTTAFIIVVMVMLMSFMLVMMLMLVVVVITSTFIMMVFMLIMIVVMVMLVMVMSTATFVLVIMVMMFSMFMYMSAFRAYLFFCHQFFFQRYRFLHNLKDLLSIQFLDRSSDNCCFCIDPTEKFHCLLCFLLINNVCTAHNDCAGIFNLIVKELTKVSHVHFAFLCIYYSCVAVQYDIYISLNTLYRFDNI